MTTLFKKIIDGQIPADIVYQDDLCLAFRDVSPQAPTHILIIPKKEIPSLRQVKEKDGPLMAHLMLIARRLAEQLDLDDTGYRLVINCGQHGGQSVDHLHIHLLGGRQMEWPPG